MMMAFVPATFEILAYVLFAPSILHISLTDAAVMGAVMRCSFLLRSSFPRMVALMEERRGTAEGMPQMILAGASCDDMLRHRPVYDLCRHGAGRQLSRR